MAQRRHHYERAFETLLRTLRVPYVAVDEAKKALLPPGAVLEYRPETPGDEEPRKLKNFDFVVYGDDQNLLVEIKGRKLPAFRAGTRPRLECWVSEDDARSLGIWRRLFGQGFDAAFVFVYWCEDQPPDGLFDEVFERDGRWYVARAVLLDDYVRLMKPRSPRWRTVDLPTAAYERVARPFAAFPAQASMEHRSFDMEAGLDGGGGGAGLSGSGPGPVEPAMAALR